jgi:hypothetical protein
MAGYTALSGRLPAQPGAGTIRFSQAYVFAATMNQA